MTQDAEVLSSTSRLLHGEITQGLLSRNPNEIRHITCFPEGGRTFTQGSCASRGRVNQVCSENTDEPLPSGLLEGLQHGEQHYFNTRHDAQPNGLAAKSIADVPHPEHLRSSFWKLGEFTHPAALVCLSKSNNVAELHSRLAFMCLSHV